jgi:hypothetical protein
VKERFKVRVQRDKEEHPVIAAQRAAEEQQLPQQPVVTRIQHIL